MLIPYAVITVGCTECNGGPSSPETELVTDDFAEASKLAQEISIALGALGDTFVVRLTDGAVVAKLETDDQYQNTWIETE